MSLFGPDSVYTMPAAARFADSLAQGLLTTFTDPVALARVQIFLPNRRAIRALSDALLRRADGKALILPRLSALGDMGDDDTDSLRSGEALDLPPPLSDLERLLAILPLVSDGLVRLYGRRSSFSEALRYARALLRIFDQLQYGGIAKPDIAALAQGGDFAEHWQRILVFLDIALDYWPAKLAELNASDPVAYRIAQIDALTARWTRTPPAHPVIAAGTTGTISAVSRLLKRIAALPQGCVLLPPIPVNDVQEDALWQALGPTHPGFALKQLIDMLDRTPDSIALWPHATAADCPDDRIAWATDAFLPADMSHRWRDLPHGPQPGMRMVEAAHPAEEAQVIALALRQALDMPDRTAALVTPDRDLARRVADQLQRFGIDIDDSAGTPLAASRPAVFLGLLSDVALQACAPVPLLSLLKHPLCHGSSDRLAWLNMVRRLDASALRGPRPAAGWHGMRAAAASHDVAPLLDTLEASLQPWLAAHDGSARTLSNWVQLHVTAAEALAGEEALWAGEAGQAVQQLLQALADSDQRLSGADYALLLQDLLRAQALRPVYGKHPRLFIWGPLEARLQRCDLMILGGLNEAVWPQPADIDPILNEAMRLSLGLPTTEFRIGQSAMDFLHALCAPEVLLTRAQKLADTPAISSRFLQRLRASAPAALPADEMLLQAARGLDQPAHYQLAQEPLPVPALSLRPRLLHVTDVERLRRNPYAFYARKILNLSPLDELDAEPGAAEKGIRIHEALERYFSTSDGDLLQHLKLAFADLWDRPQVQALWLPRFRLMAEWIAAQADPAWQHGMSEATGVWILKQIEPPFEVRGRADRIDISADGQSLRIIDYKTGTAPSAKQVIAGFALQLPLLALIAERGGFENLEALQVKALEAWQLKGKADDAGKITHLFKDRSSDIREQVQEAAKTSLLQLINWFDRPDTAYNFKSGPARGGGHDYDHLARVDAWQGRRP